MHSNIDFPLQAEFSVMWWSGSGFLVLIRVSEDFMMNLHTWNAKCPIFLGNFTPKTSNYCLKNRALGFPGSYIIQINVQWVAMGSRLDSWGLQKNGVAPWSPRSRCRLVFSWRFGESKSSSMTCRYIYIYYGVLKSVVLEMCRYVTMSNVWYSYQRC